MENMVRKGEIACDKQFLLFSPLFRPHSTYFSFYTHFTMAICFNLDESKILLSGNGLNDNILAAFPT